MKASDVKTNQVYKAKVIGFSGIKKIKVTGVLTNTVICEVIGTGQNGVAKLGDLKEI